MDEDAKKARREYFRAWRKANKDKVKLYNATYWIKRSKKK